MGAAGDWFSGRALISIGAIAPPGSRVSKWAGVSRREWTRVDFSRGMDMACRSLLRAAGWILAAAVLGSAAGPAGVWAMDLEGKISYATSLDVKNAYPGTCTRVEKRYGDEVQQNQVLGYYRLDKESYDSIQHALRDGDLRSKQAELRVFDARLDEARLKVTRLQEAVQASVASQASLDVARAELNLLEVQRDVAQREAADIATRLDDVRARLREDLGGVPLARGGSAPWEIPLVAPGNGVVAEQNIASGDILPKGTRCFRVAPRMLYVKCRVYAEDYVKLQTGDKATFTLPNFPGRTFEAVLEPLPLTMVDRGYSALSYYEILFSLPATDFFVREGVRVKVHVPDAR